MSRVTDPSRAGDDVDPVSSPAAATATPSSPPAKLRLVDMAYERIRDDLINLRIEPGEPLDEKQLCAALQVGLTPVRDAIKRLTLERLVITYPRRGTFAAEIKVSDELWLTEARVEMEGLAAALAAQRANAADHQAMLTLALQLENRENSVDLDYLDVDTQIHRVIYAAARNPYLESNLNQYANLALRIWHYVLRSSAPRPVDRCSQLEVVTAIIDRNPDQARAAASEHLRDFSAEVRAMLAGTS